jgi:hypothetical protein
VDAWQHVRADLGPASRQVSSGPGRQRYIKSPLGKFVSTGGTPSEVVICSRCAVSVESTKRKDLQVYAASWRCWCRTCMGGGFPSPDWVSVIVAPSAGGRGLGAEVRTSVKGTGQILVWLGSTYVCGCCLCTYPTAWHTKWCRRLAVKKPTGTIVAVDTVLAQMAYQ